MSERFKTGQALTLGGAHFVHDLYTAFLAPILPLLIAKHSLSLTLAGTLPFFLNLASFGTPLLGAFIDRHGMTRRLVVIAPTLSAIAICLVGTAPGYGMVVLVLILASTSVAALHVAGPVVMASVSGNRMGRGMSMFMVGGELARTVGPLIAVQAVSLYTLEGIWRLAMPAVALSVFLGFRLRKIAVPTHFQSTAEGANIFRNLRDTLVKMRRILWVVLAIMITRSFMTAVCTHYLPTFLHMEGMTLWRANIALSLLEAGGVAGVLTSGTVSDWLGRRGVLLLALITAPPLMLLFLVVPPTIGLAVLVAIGFVVLSTTPVLMALVIEQSTVNRAAASGTFVMMNFAVRSLVLLIVGLLGDLFGLRTTFAVCAGAGLMGLPFALKLPKGR